jgi:hypothetical protein
MNGANNSTVFYDDSPNHRTVTPSGGALISTTQSKFGGSSGYFDGSNDYLSANNADFATCKTVDFWMWKVGAWTTNPGLISSTAVANGYIQCNSSPHYYGVGNADKGNWGTPSTDAWHHYALTCDGTNATTYLDGVQVTQVAYTGYVINANDLYIAQYPSYPINAYFAEFRLSSNVRWAAAFTPPTKQLI